MSDVIVTGASGQLGHALKDCQPEGMTVLYVGSEHLDVTDAVAVSRLIEAEHPDVVINCAAYTAVDQAETQSALAYAINRDTIGEGYQHFAEVNIKI